MPKNLLKLLLIIGIFPLIASCSKFDKIQKSEDMDEKLKAAYAYYEDKEYYKASVLLDDLVPLLRGKSDAEKASFIHADCFINMKQYVMSAHYFKEFADTYPRSPYTEQARFLYAKSLYKDSPKHNLDQTNSFLAMKAIQSFANRHPNSEYMPEINAMTDDINKKLEIKSYESAKIYYNLGDYNLVNYKSAVIAFENFMANYPESPHNEEFSFLKIDAQYKLAKQSVEKMQKPRFYDAIEFYQNFIDKYPSSKYRKTAESIYENCLNRIGQKEEIN